MRGRDNIWIQVHLTLRPCGGQQSGVEVLVRDAWLGQVGVPAWDTHMATFPSPLLGPAILAPARLLLPLWAWLRSTQLGSQSAIAQLTIRNKFSSLPREELGRATARLLTAPRASVPRPLPGQAAYPDPGQPGNEGSGSLSSSPTPASPPGSC